MPEALLAPEDPLREAAVAGLLGVYVLAVVYATRSLYQWMRSRGLPHNVAIYYDRKVIHMLAGGVVALLTPFVFTSPLTPLVTSLALSAFLAYHRRRSLLYWFQSRENAYEVNFTIAWGVSVFVLWLATGDSKLAVLPALFIAFGDAVTGIIRNAVFARRTKHWYGNVGMLAVTLPLGLALAGVPGAVAAIVASIVERFEFPPIDDNILIAASSAAILLAAAL